MSARIGVLLLVLMSMTACGGSGGLDATEKRDAVGFTESAVSTLLTYSPRTVRDDVEEARELTTDSFGTSFATVMSEQAASRIRRTKATSRATAIRAGLLDADPDRPVVLVYLVQETQSHRPKQARTDKTALRVTLHKRKAGGWKIADIDPIDPDESEDNGNG